MLIDSYQKVLRSDGEGTKARKEKIKADVSERTKRRIKLADSATREQVHEILCVGPRGNARVESYLELCERVNKGESLNEEEQARYDRDRALIGKYMELGGRVRRREGGGSSRPRSTRYRDDAEKTSAMNTFNEIRAKRMREEAERKEAVEPSMWGKRLLEQRERAAQGRKQRQPESGKGLTISGSRSGKLTLTGQ